MKYMCEYTIRTAGLSFDQNIAGGEALLTAFSKWKPEEEKGLTIHAFVAGRGGFILVETDRAGSANLNRTISGVSA